MSILDPHLPGQFISGEWTESNGERIPVYDPSTGEEIGSSRAASPSEVDAAVQSAAAAQPAWGALPAAARAAKLFAFADVLVENIDELIHYESVNAGKPITAVRDDEIHGIIDAVRLIAGAGRALPGISAAEYIEGSTSFVRREPIGVIAAITPWNYPLLQVVAKVAPALAVGNTAVVKPSGLTPLSTALLVQLAAQVLPAGVLNLVTGNGAETGKELVEHPLVGVASFTGSVGGGQAVAASAALGPKKVILELGGNAPVVVFEDADIAKAASGINIAALYNTGQECMAATRILVQESRAEEFTDALRKEFSAMVVGDVRDEATTVGPIISLAHRDRIEGLLSRAKDAGRSVEGGERLESSGYFLTPAIVTGVTQDDEIVQEEIFGPVVTIQTFSTEAEGLELANDTRYGLAASVWTGNVGRAMRLSQQIQAGTVWVNTHLEFGPDLPVSGYKESGYGVENTMLGAIEFTRLKQVMISDD